MPVVCVSGFEGKDAKAKPAVAAEVTESIAAHEVDFSVASKRGRSANQASCKGRFFCKARWARLAVTG